MFGLSMCWRCGYEKRSHVEIRLQGVRIGSVETAYTTSAVACACESGRDLHHECLAEPPKGFLVGLNVPRTLRDVVVVLVDDNPALLEIGKTGTPALDGANLQGNSIGLRRLCRSGEKRQMGQAIIGTTHGDNDAGRSSLSAFGFTALVLPSPEIWIGDDLTG